MVEVTPLSQILPIAGTLRGTIVGIVGNHLATRNRHRREKTWDRRIETYSGIVAVLTRARQIGASVAEAYAEDAHWAHQDDGVQGLEAEVWRLYRSAWTAVDENYLLLSEVFIRRMDHLRSEMAGVNEDDDPPDRHKALMEVLEGALPAIVEQAKREVRL
jgi:hypothetical protein